MTKIKKSPKIQMTKSPIESAPILAGGRRAAAGGAAAEGRGLEAGCRRPGARPAGGAAAEGRGGLRVRRARPAGGAAAEGRPKRPATVHETAGRGDGATADGRPGAKARGRGDELRQAQAGGGRGCGRVARLAWAAGQAATKPRANPRLRQAEA